MYAWTGETSGCVPRSCECIEFREIDVFMEPWCFFSFFLQTLLCRGVCVVVALPCRVSSGSSHFGLLPPIVCSGRPPHTATGWPHPPCLIPAHTSLWCCCWLFPAFGGVGGHVILQASQGGNAMMCRHSKPTDHGEHIGPRTMLYMK